MPNLCSFNDTPAKYKAEKDLARWEAAERRRLSKDLITISTEPKEEETNYSSDEEGEIDGVIVTNIHRSLTIQIDLTLQDLRNMEFNNQKHIEVCTLQGHNSEYPSKEQLQGNSKLLLFYTGLQSFTIFMAIFEHESFLLTL